MFPYINSYCTGIVLDKWNDVARSAHTINNHARAITHNYKINEKLTHCNLVTTALQIHIISHSRI